MEAENNKLGELLGSYMHLNTLSLWKFEDGGPGSDK
jgi:hypothetical protein